MGCLYSVDVQPPMTEAEWEKLEKQFYKTKEPEPIEFNHKKKSKPIDIPICEDSSQIR